MTRTDVVVVSYQRRDLLLRCCETVHAHAPQANLIVVDNASADGSAAAIRASFPEVHVIESPENLGFGRAVNLGAESALGDYLLLLNPDTRLLDRALEKLVAFAEAHPEAGLYGGVAVGADGLTEGASCWNRPTVWSSLCRGLGLAALFPGDRWLDSESVRLVPSRRVQPVDIVSGCFLLIRRELWKALGGFDPAFFMYGEDFDLSLRARALGARPLVTLDARLVHHGGASEHDDADRLVRLLRSKAQLFDRHFSRPSAWAGKRALWLWALTRRIGYAAAARLAGRGAGSAQAWREVWRRRAEFLRVPPPAGAR